jgi:hypothetical protein
VTGKFESKGTFKLLDWYARQRRADGSKFESKELSNALIDTRAVGTQTGINMIIRII